jgi:hypothetical protein
MFTKPYRRSTFSNSRVRNRRKGRTHLRNRLLWGLAGLVGLELLLRAIAPMMGLGAIANQAQINQIAAHELKFVNAQKQPYAALPSDGKLLAVRDPLLGYRLLPQQRSQFVQINAQGFRDAEDVPLQKPSGEVRIFILGGSTAFGQLTRDADLFSNQLETALNAQVAEQKTAPTQFQPEILPYTIDDVNKVMQRPIRIPDRVYRVVNVAVPGYAMGNDLALLTQAIARYRPDMVIVMDNYADLTLPSSTSAAEMPNLDNLLAGKPTTLNPANSVNNFLGSFYLVKLAQSWINPPTNSLNERLIALNSMAPNADQPLVQQLNSDANERSQRLNRYRDQVTQMVNWSKLSKQRLMFVLAPALAGRTEQSPAEKAIAQKLGNTYSQQMTEGQATLKEIVTAAAGSSKVLDLYKIDGKTKGTLFQSPVSLTKEGNQLLAEQLKGAIANQFAIDPKPYEAGQR